MKTEPKWYVIGLRPDAIVDDASAKLSRMFQGYNPSIILGLNSFPHLSLLHLRSDSLPSLERALTTVCKQRYRFQLNGLTLVPDNEHDGVIWAMVNVVASRQLLSLQRRVRLALKVPPRIATAQYADEFWPHITISRFSTEVIPLQLPALGNWLRASTPGSLFIGERGPNGTVTKILHRQT